MTEALAIEVRGLVKRFAALLVTPFLVIGPPGGLILILFGQPCSEPRVVAIMMGARSSAIGTDIRDI